MNYYYRHLPHWQPEDRTIFVTWRLYGSLPREALRAIELLRESPGKQFVSADRHLDAAATGPRWLAQPEIAELVQKAILRGVLLKHYILRAHVIMSNHVHVLLDPILGLTRIMSGVKGVSAREANRFLNRIGKPFWQDESFDRWIRDAVEFERVRAYIENNPVRAGLAARPEDWPWSSAHKRAAQ
jgi:putative transposase